jgi:hypothetical protein
VGAEVPSLRGCALADEGGGEEELDAHTREAVGHERGEEVTGEEPAGCQSWRKREREREARNDRWKTTGERIREVAGKRPCAVTSVCAGGLMDALDRGSTAEDRSCPKTNACTAENKSLPKIYFK